MKRNTALHHLWRRAVISQRGTVCESCGESEDTTVIEAHHIAEFKTWPALGYCLENGVVLCCRCHAHLHSGRRDLIDRVNSAIYDADPERAAWVCEHMNDTAPDYEDPTVIADIRKRLHDKVAEGYEGYQQRYYREHKEYFRERNAAYAKAHAEEIAAYNRQYYATHKKELNARSREYYLSHRDGLLRQYADHEARKRAKKKEWSDTYVRNHRDEKRERDRMYRATHQDQIKAYAAAHREEHNAKERERRRKKRMAKQQAAAQGRAMLESGQL